MTQLDYFLLYCRRVVGFIAFVCIQAVSFFLIIYLTIYGSTVKEIINKIPVLRPLSGSVVSIALQIIGGTTPALLKMVTEFEMWDDEWALTFLLSRIYVSNLLNILLVVLSYLILADPSFLYAYPLISGPFALKPNARSAPNPLSPPTFEI
jgi:hypothetical protein